MRFACDFAEMCFLHNKFLLHLVQNTNVFLVRIMEQIQWYCILGKNTVPLYFEIHARRIKISVISVNITTVSVNTVFLCNTVGDPNFEKQKFKNIKRNHINCGDLRKKWCGAFLHAVDGLSRTKEGNGLLKNGDIEKFRPIVTNYMRQER